MILGVNLIAIFIKLLLKLIFSLYRLWGEGSNFYCSLVGKRNPKVSPFLLGSILSAKVFIA
jgi:hypothetical protein